MLVEHVMQQLQPDHRIVQHEHALFLVIGQRQQFAAVAPKGQGPETGACGVGGAID